MRSALLVLLAGCASVPPEESGVDGWTVRMEVHSEKELTVFDVTFKNVTSAPRPLVPVERWDVVLPGVIMESRGQARMVVTQTSGRRPDACLYGSGGHHGRTPRSVDVAPGGEWVARYGANLGPGTYAARMIYYYVLGEDGISSLEAGPIEFTVPE